MVTKEHIAETLKDYRKRSHLSQESVAEKLNFAQKDISNIENCKSGIDSITKICLIADLLKIPYPVLFFDDKILSTPDRFIKVETELGTIEYDKSTNRLVQIDKNEKIYQNRYKNPESSMIDSDYQKENNIMEDNKMEKIFDLRKEFQPKNQIAENPDIILSQNIKYKYDKFSNNNVVVVGGSGSGKYQYYIKPNIQNCSSNYIVFGCTSIDDTLITYMKEQGSKVIRIGYDFNGEVYDIFKHIKDDFSMSDTISGIIDADGSNVTYKAPAQIILAAVMQYIIIFDKLPETIKEIYFKEYFEKFLKYDYQHLQTTYKIDMLITLLDYINDSKGIYLGLDKIFEKLPQAMELWKKFKYECNNQAVISKAIIILKDYFNLLKTLKITENIDYADLKHEKYFIYLDFDIINPVKNQFYSVVFNQITKDIVDDDPDIHQRFIMDECCAYNIKSLSHIHKCSRPNKISIDLICQSTEQLMCYMDGRSMINNSSMILFMGSSSVTTLNDISNIAGSMKVKITATSVERVKLDENDRFAQLVNNHFAQNNPNEVYDTIDKITAAELAQLKKNECVIISDDLYIDTKYQCK